MALYVNDEGLCDPATAMTVQGSVTVGGSAVGKRYEVIPTSESAVFF